jgi:hypothetical protein
MDTTTKNPRISPWAFYISALVRSVLDEMLDEKHHSHQNDDDPHDLLALAGTFLFFTAFHRAKKRHVWPPCAVFLTNNPLPLDLTFERFQKQLSGMNIFGRFSSKG